MSSDSSKAIELMSEADLEPVLALLQGADPETVARKAGISTARLFKIRDDLLASVAQERAKMVGAPAKKNRQKRTVPLRIGEKIQAQLPELPCNGRTDSRPNRQESKSPERDRTGMVDRQH